MTDGIRGYDRRSSVGAYENGKKTKCRAYEEKTSEVAKSTELTNSEEVAELPHGREVEVEEEADLTIWRREFAGDQAAIDQYLSSEECQQWAAGAILAREGRAAARAYIFENPDLEHDDGRAERRVHG
jgi:hypothetical protein